MTAQASDVCGASTMGPDSVNVHFHGTNTSPVCHQDEVIHTLINSGETFTYDVKFPDDEPPGLYWYDPHVHGIAEAAVLGGASGAIVVAGLQDPAGSERTAATDPCDPRSAAGGPSASRRSERRAVMGPDAELRADFISAIHACHRPNNARQETALARGECMRRFDSRPAGSIRRAATNARGRWARRCSDRLSGRHAQGKIVPVTDILLPTAARVEFIVTGPSTSVQNATFLTLNVDTVRSATLIRSVRSRRSTVPARAVSLTGRKCRRSVVPPDHSALKVSRRRNQRLSALYIFRRWISVALRIGKITAFFITVDGATPEVFNPDNPPAITTTQGSVEDWTIQNRSPEVHEFHIHQIHFLLLAVNGVPVPRAQQQLHDMVQVPYWSGSGPYPSVTVRMDFRGPDIGDFVYHCHILAHEDGGMMAIMGAAAQDGMAGRYGNLRTLFASLGWPDAEKAAWCVSGGTVERDRDVRPQGRIGDARDPSSQSDVFAAGRRGLLAPRAVALIQRSAAIRHQRKPNELRPSRTDRSWA